MSSRVLVSVWNDVIDDPKFSAEINGGLGQMTVRLARSVFNTGITNDIVLGYEVDVMAYDADSPLGTRVYTGTIISYEPVVDGSDEYVEVVLFSNMNSLSDTIAKDNSGNTTFTETGDPGTILKHLVDRYGGKITYSSTSIDLAGVSLTVKFNTMTWLDAITSVVSLSPTDWYFYVGADNLLHFHKRLTTATHKLTLGRNLLQLNFTSSIESLKNNVIVVGGGTPALLKEYSNTDSIATYGKKTQLIYDTNITSTSQAQAAALKVLNEQSAVLTDVTLAVVDNNGPDPYLGYDIESIHPGQTLQVLGLGNSNVQTLWDVAIWDVSSWDFSLSDAAAQVLQITRVDYTPDQLTLDFTKRNYEIGSYVDDISRQLQNFANQNNPAVPS